ncbi:Bifunctional nuclease 2 [Vitis vinifera]|uniref:Bifunctional nuclease 2 n=1 Tax=Vitis vinifera TaxID=29760 RepID=A0A438K5G7_VITVI|nr:Bifunctional nuclease 2 [Vitis vinifera]
MLRAHLCLPTVSGAGLVAQQLDGSRLVSNSLVSFSSRFSFQLGFRGRHCRGSKSVIISCRASRGSSGDRSANGEDRDQDYLEAFVLISETISHHQMRKQGFLEGNKWQSWGQLHPFSAQTKDLRPDVSSIGQGFLRRFQSPTIFLKVSCDGDFLLPIIVGEFSVEKLIDTLREDEIVDCPNQFQFVRDLVGKLGYKVNMVKITERIVNTYFARIYFSKPGENNIQSVDARPSDAINVAKLCKVFTFHTLAAKLLLIFHPVARQGCLELAKSKFWCPILTMLSYTLKGIFWIELCNLLCLQVPIYVNKQIILTDAIRIVYGMGRARDTKSVYDVVLDSAADGPDLLAEELDLVRNMSLAIKEERYNDAALWRDKLMKLRESRHEL